MFNKGELVWHEIYGIGEIIFSEKNKESINLETANVRFQIDSENDVPSFIVKKFRKSHLKKVEDAKIN